MSLAISSLIQLCRKLKTIGKDHAFIRDNATASNITKGRYGRFVNRMAARLSSTARSENNWVCDKLVELVENTRELGKEYDYITRRLLNREDRYGGKPLSGRKALKVLKEVLDEREKRVSQVKNFCATLKSTIEGSGLRRFLDNAETKPNTGLLELTFALKKDHKKIQATLEKTIAFRPWLTPLALKLFDDIAQGSYTTRLVDRIQDRLLEETVNKKEAPTDADLRTLTMRALVRAELHLVYFGGTHPFIPQNRTSFEKVFAFITTTLTQHGLPAPSKEDFKDELLAHIDAIANTWEIDENMITRAKPFFRTTSYIQDRLRAEAAEPRQPPIGAA